MKELTIGVADMPRRIGEYTALLGKPVGDALWQLSDSQMLRLVEADSDGIQSVTLEVDSLERAAEFLRSKSMLGSISEGRMEISPESLHGLRIYLK